MNAVNGTAAPAVTAACFRNERRSIEPPSSLARVGGVWPSSMSISQRSRKLVVTVGGIIARLDSLEVSMSASATSITSRLPAIAVLAVIASAIGVQPSLQAQTAVRRPMTFLDMQQMRQVGSPTPSPDRRLLLYTLSTPDWKEAKRQTDLYLVSMQTGTSSTRQMTFTKEKNETSPQWAPDGSYFFFLSNREAPENSSTRNQLYMMRPDGGEARRLSDTREGVSEYRISRDGRWLVYGSGKSGEEQLYRLPLAAIETATAEQITKHPTGITSWQWAPDSRRIYFVTPDQIDEDEKIR